jgi:hypothetical protein
MSTDHFMPNNVISKASAVRTAALVALLLALAFVHSSCGVSQSTMTNEISTIAAKEQVKKEQFRLSGYSVTPKFPYETLEDRDAYFGDGDRLAIRQEIKDEHFKKEFAGKISQAFYAIVNATTWQAAHQSAMRYLGLKKEANVPDLHSIEQLTAQSMLRYFFLDPPLSREKQQAIEYYLNILLRYNNHAYILMNAECLVRLQGYWTNEQVADVARQALRTTRSWFKSERDAIESAWEYQATVDSSAAPATSFARSSIDERQRILQKQYSEHVNSPFAAPLPGLTNEELVRLPKKDFFYTGLRGIALMSVLANLDKTKR